MAQQQQQQAQLHLHPEASHWMHSTANITSIAATTFSIMSIRNLENAIYRGDVDWMHRLVFQQGVDIHTPLPFCGMTALHLAVERGNLTVVQWLLEHAADTNNSIVNAVDDGFGKTPLHYAAQYNAGLEIIQQLLHRGKANINARDVLGRTVLHFALYYGAPLNVVECLLNHHEQPDAAADERMRMSSSLINATDVSGSTPLHSISNRGVSASVMQLLLSRGADIYAQEQNMLTPLHLLVGNDCFDAVRVLLHHLSHHLDCPGIVESVLLRPDKENQIPFRYVRSAAMAKLLLLQSSSQRSRRAADVVVPRVCRDMLFARDAGQTTIFDVPHFDDALRDYLASFASLPVTVPNITDTNVPVRLNPLLDTFQSTVANKFVKKWSGWSTLFCTSMQQEDDDMVVVEQQTGVVVGDMHLLLLLLPDELKYVVVSYLSVADIIQIAK